MKYRALVFAAIVLFLALGLSGCGKDTWIAKFTEMDDLEGWTVFELYDLSDDGLFLEEGDFVSPYYAWMGDYSLTIKFGLSTNDDVSAEVTVLLSRVPIGDGDSYISFYFLEGDPMVEFNSVRASGPYSGDHIIYDQGWGLPGILADQVNTMLIVKSGDHYAVTMNGSPIWDFEDAYYQSPFSYVSIGSTCYGISSTPPILFKSLEVEYVSGNMI